MNSLRHFFTEVFPVMDHLLSVIITLLIIGLFLVIRKGFPYLKHIALVAAADDQEGEVRLAKHLAKQAGGKRINVDHTWSTFVGPARELYRNHLNKRINLNSDS